MNDSIAFIEDDDLIRLLFEEYFIKSDYFAVCFAVCDIRDALDQKNSEPDIILLDAQLASVSGIESIPLLKKRFPESKIVILSNIKDVEMTQRAIELGAVGYLLKTSSLEYISETLKKIKQGGLSFSPETIPHLLAPKPVNDHNCVLSKREMEIAALISEGLSNKMIADSLNIAYFTVNDHLKHIYKKLNINSKSELTARFLKAKLH